MSSWARPGDPEPRPAATVVLLRDAPGGYEVLLTIRPRHLRFMGGAAVFPGGALAEADTDPRWERASRRTAAQAAAALGPSDGAELGALGPFVCALREAFEEVGWLCGDGVDALERAAAEDPARFLQACLDHGVRLGTDELIPAGRWVTPLGSPIRFDARFFLARAEPSWEPAPDATEVAGCRWLTPRAALDALGAGDIIMAPPTIEMLQRLESFSGAAEALLAATEERAPRGRVQRARLSPLVQTVLAPNASRMTGPGTNTYIVGAGTTAIIDPAVPDDEYLDEVAAAQGEPAFIAVTHRHPDHVGGAERLSGRLGIPVRAFGKEPAGGAAVDPLADQDVLEISGARLKALHTPGHSSDHLCFLLEGVASLLSGDVILGEGTSVIAPPDGDMRAYLESLRRLRELDLQRIYPGHFRPLDGGDEVIDRYLAHRAERARAIGTILKKGPATPEQIVAAVYTQTDEQLHDLARESVRAHLEMLRTAGRARVEDDRWTAVEETPSGC
ncbi:MAG: MBL fold metallo-hydrolase [Actinobacteria bacterium]|nr:MBL fold metallo-hydrolase [Actinomycetota bacterium]